MLLAGAVLLAVLLAGESSRAMLASARLSCVFLLYKYLTFKRRRDNPVERRRGRDGRNKTRLHPLYGRHCGVMLCCRIDQIPRYIVVKLRLGTCIGLYGAVSRP